MINPVIYADKLKEFVDCYDGATYQIWNAVDGVIVELRKHIRNHYLHQQNFMCAYCRIEKKELHGLTWDIEHILAKSKYPSFLFEPQNLAIACKECNAPKDDREILLVKLRNTAELPTNTEAYAIVHPHFDRYSDHFEISVVGGRRIYRILNKDKASFTYVACNLMRFDFQYAEWESFNKALVGEVSEFLDNCPHDANPQEIKRMLGHLKFCKDVDF